MQFIEIEGITGSGKTTLVPYLKNCLEKEGFLVQCVKEPGSTKLGLDIRNLVANKHHSKLSSLTQMFLFLANRSDINDQYLKKCDKDIVLFDRYYGSTFVYQILGSNTEFKFKKLALLNKAMNLIFNRKRPVDATILLDVEPKIALQRIRKRQKVEFRSDHEISNDEFFLKTNKKLREYFKEYLLEEEISVDKVIIDANGSIDETVQLACSSLISMVT